jgi:hypothetical protein
VRPPPGVHNSFTARRQYRERPKQRRQTRRNVMRRTMVVGAVILAIVAMVGIGFAAFNAGVDEGISRDLAQSEQRRPGGQGCRAGLRVRLRPRVRVPVRADPVPTVHHRDRAAGAWSVLPRPLGRSPLVGGLVAGARAVPEARAGTAIPAHGAAARRRSTSTTGACTSSPGRRPVRMTLPAGAPPGRPRPTPGPSSRDELDRRPTRRRAGRRVASAPPPRQASGELGGQP